MMPPGSAATTQVLVWGAPAAVESHVSAVRLWSEMVALGSVVWTFRARLVPVPVAALVTTTVVPLVTLEIRVAAGRLEPAVIYIPTSLAVNPAVADVTVVPVFVVAPSATLWMNPADELVKSVDIWAVMFQP